MEGFANIDGGLLISLRGIKSLDYDEKTQTQRSGLVIFGKMSIDL
jgi:hypothetical protein